MAGGGTYVDPVLAGTLAVSFVGNEAAQLTQSERDVLRLLAEGLANEEIGNRFGGLIGLVLDRSSRERALLERRVDDRSLVLRTVLRTAPRRFRSQIEHAEPRVLAVVALTWSAAGAIWC